MTNLTHELDFIDLELGISEPVAIQDSDEVDNASDGSVSESADSEQSPISTEDCFGTSDEEEDEEETEERIHNSCRDQLLLQSSTRALRVDALEARDVHEEAARTAMARLDHLSGLKAKSLTQTLPPLSLTRSSSCLVP